MSSVFGGLRPDITPAQIVGTLVAGVPIVANLLRAFGVYDLTRAARVASAGASVEGAGARGARHR